MAIAIGLLKTLLELARSKKSGAIDVRSGGSRVRLFVEDGAVVFADEGTIGETLGRILVRENVIREDQYNAALERMAELRAKGKSTRLGEVLLAMKALTKAQLDAALSAQVRQKVVRAIGAGASSFRFVECHGPLEIAARFATPVEPLVLAALRLAPEESVEEMLDLALTRYPILRGDGTAKGGPLRAETLKRVDAFELQPDERAFALALVGDRTTAELLGETTHVPAAVVLAALLLTDCLDLEANPASRRSMPAAAPTKKPLRRLATPVTPQRAIRPIVKKKAPSSVRPHALEAKEQARAVAARLKAAQDAKKAVPSRPPEPPPSEPKVGELALWKPEATLATPRQPMDRLLAEQAFQAGKAHVRANDMAAAAVELRRAATLFPAIEYELWAAWTEMRADKTGEASHVAGVRALAEKALEEDPSLGFAYFALGHLALRARDAVRARELFAKARALDPATTTDAKDVRLRDAKKQEEATATPAPAAAPAPAQEVEAEAEKKEKEEEPGPAPAPARRAPVVPLAVAAVVLGAIGLWAATRGQQAPETPKLAPAASVSATAAPSVSASAMPEDAGTTALALDDDETTDAAPADVAAPDAAP